MSWAGAVMSWAGAVTIWAGALTSMENPYLNFSTFKLLKNAKKVKCDGPTDRRTDGRTDRHSDLLVALPATKMTKGAYLLRSVMSTKSHASRVLNQN